MRKPQNMHAIRHWIGILGTIVEAIGATAFSGHMLNIGKLYIWIQDVGMAFNTSIGFMAIGLALIIISLSDRLWNQ